MFQSWDAIHISSQNGNLSDKVNVKLVIMDKKWVDIWSLVHSINWMRVKVQL